MDHKHLKKRLSYNPDTGVFIWKKKDGCCRFTKTFNSRYAGKIAGNISVTGYRRIYVGGRSYYAHRLVWLYIYGELPIKEIDHINHNRADNRLSNLRAVSRKENSVNITRRCDNKTGVMGVTRDKSRWAVSIDNSFKGRFNDFFEAVCVRKKLESQLGYHVNHGVSH